MFEGRVGYKAAIIKLQYILFYIHNNALIRCLEEFIDKTLFVCIETFGLLEEEFSMTDIKPFYITILLQAINNMYDAGCSIAKKKQVFQVNLLQGITFWLALIDLISAVCFLGNPQLQSVASRKGVILLSCIFVGFILLLLYREIFVHLSIIYRREKYSAGSSVRNVIEPKDLGMQSDCDDACNWDDKENNYD